MTYKLDHKNAVNAGVQKLFKKFNKGNPITQEQLMRLREEYPDTELADAIQKAYITLDAKVNRKAKKIALAVHAKYGTRNVPYHYLLEKVLIYKQRYNFSDDVFIRFQQYYEKHLLQQQSPEILHPAGKLMKNLGYVDFKYSPNVSNLSDTDYSYLQEIIKLNAMTKQLYAQAYVQSHTYELTINSTEILNRDFNPSLGDSKIGPYIHPVIVAFFIDKIKEIDTHFIFSNIANIVESRYYNKPLNMIDLKLFNALIRDPNDMVCNSQSVYGDLLSRAKIQHYMWENIVNMREGNFYRKPAFVALVQELQSCRSFTQDEHNYLYGNIDGLLLRRLFAAFSFSPTLTYSYQTPAVHQIQTPGSIVPLTMGYVSYSNSINPFHQYIRPVVSSIPFIHIRMPMYVHQSLAPRPDPGQPTLPCIDFQNVLSKQSLVNNVYNASVMNTHVIYSYGVLVFYVDKREYKIHQPYLNATTLSNIIFPSGLPTTILQSNLHSLNKSVKINYKNEINLTIKNKEYKYHLQSVVLAETIKLPLNDPMPPHTIATRDARYKIEPKEIISHSSTVFLVRPSEYTFDPLANSRSLTNSGALFGMTGDKLTFQKLMVELKTIINTLECDAELKVKITRFYNILQPIEVDFVDLFKLQVLINSLKSIIQYYPAQVSLWYHAGFMCLVLLSLSIQEIVKALQAKQLTHPFSESTHKDMIDSMKKRFKDVIPKFRYSHDAANHSYTPITRFYTYRFIIRINLCRNVVDLDRHVNSWLGWRNDDTKILYQIEDTKELNQSSFQKYIEHIQTNDFSIEEEYIRRNPGYWCNRYVQLKYNEYMTLTGGSRRAGTDTSLITLHDDNDFLMFNETRIKTLHSDIDSISLDEIIKKIEKDIQYIHDGTHATFSYDVFLVNKYLSETRIPNILKRISTARHIDGARDQLHRCMEQMKELLDIHKERIQKKEIDRIIKIIESQSHAELLKSDIITSPVKYFLGAKVHYYIYNWLVGTHIQHIIDILVNTDKEAVSEEIQKLNDAQANLQIYIDTYKEQFDKANAAALHAKQAKEDRIKVMKAKNEEWIVKKRNAWDAEDVDRQKDSPRPHVVVPPYGVALAVAPVAPLQFTHDDQLRSRRLASHEQPEEYWVGQDRPAQQPPAAAQQPPAAARQPVAAARQPVAAQQPVPPQRVPSVDRFNSAKRPIIFLFTELFQSSNVEWPLYISKIFLKEIKIIIEILKRVQIDDTNMPKLLNILRYIIRYNEYNTNDSNINDYVQNIKDIIIYDITEYYESLQDILEYDISLLLTFLIEIFRSELYSQSGGGYIAGLPSNHNYVELDKFTYEEQIWHRYDPMRLNMDKGYHNLGITPPAKHIIAIAKEKDINTADYDCNDIDLHSNMERGNHYPHVYLRYKIEMYGMIFVYRPEISNMPLHGIIT